MRTRNTKTWKCKICSDPKTNKDPGIDCDVCSEALGLECTNYTKEVYEYMLKKNVEPSFTCKSCKETLPELKSLLDIHKQQQKLQETVDDHDTRITKCEVETEKITNIASDVSGINQRLSELEAKLIDQKEVEVITEKWFKDKDFPPINLEDVKKTQEDTQKQLEEAKDLQSKGWEEVQRREDNQKNLIIYGVPEEHKDDKTEQMKADFETLQKIYNNKVGITRTDLIQINRVGPHKDNQIRPIRITLADLQKRSEILRNNKNLKLPIELEGSTCNLEFCEDEEPHKHIYVSTDKTRQQRAEESKLRTELTTRRATEKDLIIRNGRIVKKSTTYARWSEIVKNGY